MEREFGLDDAGSIDCHPWFTKKMEALVSKQPNRMIQITHNLGFNKKGWCAEGYGERIYTITPEMIVSIEDELRDIQKRLKENP